MVDETFAVLWERGEEILGVVRVVLFVRGGLGLGLGWSLRVVGMVLAVFLDARRVGLVLALAMAISVGMFCGRSNHPAPNACLCLSSFSLLSVEFCFCPHRK